VDPQAQPWIIVAVVAVVLLLGGIGWAGSSVPRGGCVHAPPKPNNVDDSKVPRTKGPVSVTGRRPAGARDKAWWL